MGNREEHLPKLAINLNTVSLRGGQSLLNEKRQEEVLAAIKEARIKFVFIDNLLSLAPNATKTNASPLFDFISRIQDEGIAVIIIHHASKTAKDFKGPVELVSLCQNVLHIEGRDQILEKDLDQACAALQDALAEDGPVARVLVDKSKAAPHFERRHGTFKLPVGKPWKWVEGDLCAASEMHAQSTYSYKSEQNTKNDKTLRHHLPPDQQAVVDAMKAGRSYYRKGIEKDTGFKEDRVRNALNSLQKAGLVSREGSGKDTHYRLV
jgi:hypothetical protein